MRKLEIHLAKCEECERENKYCVKLPALTFDPLKQTQWICIECLVAGWKEIHSSIFKVENISEEVKEEIGRGLRLTEPIAPSEPSLGIVMVSPKGLRDVAKWVEERKELARVRGKSHGPGYPVEVLRATFEDGASKVETILFRDPEDSETKFGQTKA